MKKTVLAIAAAMMMTFSASADEGMWLLPLLQQLNANAMKDLGCRLTPDQIYSINHSSLKDAVVIFGGGCTGEVISDKGLLVTNHHCGYSSIQKLSTPEHNYLEDGYWAMDNSQEIPAPGLSVTFLVSMTDVTGKVSTEEEIGNLVKAAEADNPGCRAQVENFYNENVQYLIVYKVYNDIRFVGAPPASIGKFGGETDNWMWPRHTGDFSMFRIYAGKDNEPAAYSPDNVPYKPVQSLKISLKGVKEGDFTFIMGYPGSTQRYQTEAQLNQMMDLHDISIEARTIYQDILWKWMEKDPVIRLQYANKYAGSANGWKKWIGEKKAFEDLGIIGKERDKEAGFTRWVDKNRKRTEQYGTALQDIAEGVGEISQSRKDIMLLGETLYHSDIVGFSNIFTSALDLYLQNTKDTAEALSGCVQLIADRYSSYCEPLDREVAKAMAAHYAARSREGLVPDIFKDAAANGSLDTWFDQLYDNSVFSSLEKLKAAAEKGDPEIFRNDPASQLNKSMNDTYLKMRTDDSGSMEKIRRGSKAYTAGLLEWQKGKAFYPDANFTMRLTYGNVKAYSPKDGLLYRYYTTIYGVIEKEDPDNYEFHVPAKLKELYSKKDYGRYAMEDGNLPCCFLTNNDITGGNSGSPVLNADGELIGLAFDGNWESMSSDVMFEPDLQRCICVDIRYVLFLMDKFGGAGYLLKEMEIQK
ncbi:MAG: S46 family peptidase [Bacteroidales bacterium]|nr:S46 family peptidase [Bacteroidales bacterium]